MPGWPGCSSPMESPPNRRHADAAQAASLRPHAVLIAIGRSGDFRRLGVPGESLDKVYNRLHDPADFAGRDVLVVEDIVDTGHTLNHVTHLLESRKPARLKSIALLDKPSRREVDIRATWTGFEIPDEFVVGYGIDYAQRNRNLPYIGKVRFT